MRAVLAEAEEIGEDGCGGRSEQRGDGAVTSGRIGSGPSCWIRRRRSRSAVIGAPATWPGKSQPPPSGS